VIDQFEEVFPFTAIKKSEEADLLTGRAVKLAPDNNEVKKLREEVVKLLDPR